MKKLCGVLLAMVLVLVACGRQTEPKEVASSSSMSSSSSSSQPQVASSSPASSSQLPAPAFWTEDKSVQLRDYILTVWGPAMGQTYKAYTPATLGNFFGVPIPDGFLTATKGMTADMGGQTPELFWSMDGLAKPGQLAVVAVYADSEANRSMSQHLYVFTVDPQGVGQVWITQQNQGNPENKLYFRETQNQELYQFFVGLVGGLEPASQSQSQAEAVDTRNLTVGQAANWAAAHKAKGYGAPFSRVDFITMVTGIDQSPDGLVYVEVRENHNSEVMKAAGAAQGVASNPSFYRINAAGELELRNLSSGQFERVETSYYE